MRSAFKRWLVLHNEEWRLKGHVRIPHWFRHYIRQTREWDFVVSNGSYYIRFRPTDIPPVLTNFKELDKHTRRTRYKGYYIFEISDEELFTLQRPEYISNNVSKVL